jgi:tetratricopeptide (TPR) repeat protein
LFGLVPSQTEKVERFSPEEVEQVFRKYLPQEAVERHRAALLDLGDRVERLPVAVAVAADLLRRQFGPMDQAARKLALEKLKNEVHDVADLFDKAIQAQGPPERRLLEAASVCAPERFYLPLAFEIARLSPDEGENARDRLVNASLLRVLDSERQLFQLHALLRDRIRTTASSLENLRQAHAAALERLFARWETRWAECRECLQEIAPASQFLWSINEKSRGSWLSYSGYRTAERIGELALALHIIQCEESFWAARAGADCKDNLQRTYGDQALILQAWGRLKEALELHKKEEAICLELGNQDGLQRSYGNQALILHAWGRLEEALELHKKKEAICLELGKKQSLGYCYWNLGVLSREMGNPETAKEKLNTALAIFTELGMPGQRDAVSQALRES